MIALINSTGVYTGGFASSVQLLRQSGGTWSSSNIVSSQNDAYTGALDLAIDNNGNPLVTFNDVFFVQSTPYLIFKYAAYNGSSWKITSVDMRGAMQAFLLVGSDNATRIFYQTHPISGPIRAIFAEFIPLATPIE